MLRQLCRSFNRVLKFQQITHNKDYNVLQQYRTVYNGNNLATAIEGINTINATEPDSDYIVPYRTEQEQSKTNHSNIIIDVLSKRFRLTSTEVNNILHDECVLRAYRERQLVNTLDLLCLEGVSRQSIIDYPWLLTIDIIRLKQKIALLNTMSMEDINHFVPFLRLSVPRLRKLVVHLNKEQTSLPNGNRFYYIKNKLNIDARIISKYLSKRLFILEMPFEMLEQNLQLMLQYKVTPLDILKDLWAFRYTPRAVKTRLERATKAKKNKIMPWMVRCPEPILQRSLKLSMDELSILNGKESNLEYLAERLQYPLEEARAIMNKHPLVYRVRVTKMKEVLDYILNEAGFDTYHVAQVPRILCHSLRTTKRRVEELKAIGCHPSSLIVLCRSKQEYEKFVREWINRQKPKT